jgi:DNA replication protein DnaC
MVNQEAVESMIELYCRALKMPTLRKGFRQIFRDSCASGDSMLEFLGACLAHEIEGRHQSATAMRMKLAKFPTVKTLDSFDFTAVPSLDKTKILALADCSFVREHENLVFLGNSGLGKTHLAIALGVRCVLR